MEGLLKIVSIRASMNQGLSKTLSKAFSNSNITTVHRPLIQSEVIPNPNWLAGFVSGDGCFLISIFKGLTRVGFSVRLAFILTQHSRDELLMRSLVDYFDCGNIYFYREAIYYSITKLSVLIDKVIPLFNKYPILGVKSKNFADFCLVAELMKNKYHLTEEGLEEIRKIKAGMNRGR